MSPDDPKEDSETPETPETPKDAEDTSGEADGGDEGFGLDLTDFDVAGSPEQTDSPDDKPD